MNTQINIKKGPYVAVPKKDRSVASGDVIVTNKMKGKPFIAYPKTEALSKKPVAENITMEEGLYIAYPKNQQEKVAAETSPDASDRKWFKEAERIDRNKKWFTHRYMMCNRFCPINFADLFKLKAS